MANVSKYGAKHFSAMGKKGGTTTKLRQDPDFYSRIGKLGGVARHQKRTLENSTHHIPEP
jgi:general stress protein YciG